MEFRDPIHHHHHHPPLCQSSPPPPPPPPHQNYQQPPLISHPSSSFSFLPNPNPSSIHAFENPLPYPSSSSADALRPPGVEPYPNPNTYDPHLPFGGPHSIAVQSYQQGSSDYYYQLHQLQYGVHSSTAKVGSGNTIDDLAIKKLRVLQCGASADSVRICSICNVVCNSDKVFAFHLSGEKHRLKALGLPFNGLKPKVPAHTKALHFTKKSKHSGLKTAAKKAQISFVGSSVCDVCKIDCNSREVLNNHKLGKKHVRNLQKLQESIKLKPKPKPANDLTKNATPKANPSASGSKSANEQTTQNARPATKEDLETKKQKVLIGGAAADAVRVCMQCNVVCNSQEVYNSHIVGKKHLAMINKQQQAAPVS